MTKIDQLKRKVERAVKASGATTDDDCTLCDNAQWWIDNGFSYAERKAFCDSIGCTIPPEVE